MDGFSVLPVTSDCEFKALAFEHLLHNPTNAVALIDNNFRYIVVNQLFAEFNGCKVNDHPGKHISALSGSPLQNLASLLDISSTELASIKLPDSSYSLVCSGQLQPDTFLKECSYSMGDWSPFDECNRSRL